MFMSITSERIKKSRKEKGLTMNELAKIMGVAQSAIVRWENGTTEPKVKIIKHLAEVLEVDEAYLLGTQKEPKAIPLSEYINFLNETDELGDALNKIWSEFINRKGVNSEERKKAVGAFASLLQYNETEFHREMFSKMFDIIHTLNPIPFEDIIDDNMPMKEMD